MVRIRLGDAPLPPPQRPKLCAITPIVRELAIDTEHNINRVIVNGVEFLPVGQSAVTTTETDAAPGSETRT